MAKPLRRCRVYTVSDGDGYSDTMDEYSDTGQYYYADDVDAEIKRLKSELQIAMDRPRQSSGSIDGYGVSDGINA